VIGRIVCFEDPILAAKRPSLAIRRRGGGVWTNDAGLGWTNPYRARVWSYLIELGRAAAAHGFDEIQFDYVRFPSDGDIGQIVYPGARHEPYHATLRRFLTRARRALRPLGVKLSADVFGLAATRDLGIGQNVRRLAPLLDAISPMAYPSHYGPGEFNLPQPDDAPAAVVRETMRDFRRALRQRVRLGFGWRRTRVAAQATQIRPWLQDFALPRPYTLADVRAQIRAAERGGASGWLLWNAGNVYTRAAFAAS
jgi:hypothetical protein